MAERVRADPAQPGPGPGPAQHPAGRIRRPRLPGAVPVQLEHINQTGGVVAGALPLLYGMAEEIVADVTSHPEPPPEPEPSRPASGRRRCRLYAVGFIPARDR